MPKFSELAEIHGDDLRHFDPEAKNLVAEFQAAGWRGYVSNRGHAILHAPDEKTTTSVSRHLDRARRMKNARADLNRWNRQTDPTEENSIMTATETRVPRNTRFATTCPICGKDFPHDQARRLHEIRKHEGLTCPECGLHFPPGGQPSDYSQHRYEAHGVAPHYRKRAVVAAETPIVNEAGLYPCPWCGKEYETLHGYRSHKWRHEGEPLPEKSPEPEPEPASVVEPEPEIDEVLEDQPVPPVEPANPPAAPVGMEEWLAGQDASELITQVLAIVAAPLAGQVERLRRERDGLQSEVDRLTRWKDEHEARMALLREAIEA